MNEMLSEEEIQELLRQIQRETLRPSILKIKPIEITNISDSEEQERLLVQFNHIHDLYVRPLEKVFHYITKNRSVDFSYDLSNMSILERIKLFEKLLLGSGYTSSQILDLVPKNEEEIEIILSAKESGFVDNTVFDNQSRVSAAKSHLKYVSKIGKSVFLKKK